MFPAQTRFLVVDDTRTIRSLLCEALVNLGYHDIDQADDGSKALECLKNAYQSETPYGCIICDWNMPQLNGIELLKIKNKDPRFKSIPFLMTTVESEREFVLQAVTLGVSDYMVKPFSEATLKLKLTSIYNRHREKSPTP